MRLLPLPTTALLVLTLASPALAGVGMPKIADLRAGPHAAAIHNDSPMLRTGSNTLTVEIPSLPVGRTVSLRLMSPGGQTVEVPLRRPVVLSGPAEDHGGHGSADSHGTTGGDAHGGGQGEEFVARGSVKLDTTGTWKAKLEIRDMDGQAMTAETLLEANYGGPNRIYLAFVGSLIGSSTLYGVVQRSRQAGRRR